MVAGRYDFAIEAGATFRRTLVWKIDATPVDVTGWEARLQVRRTPTSAVLLLDIDTEPEVTVGDTDGTIEILLTDEDTQELDWHGLAYYDLELESPGGEVTRLLEGRVALVGEVTREDEAS